MPTYEVTARYMVTKKIEVSASNLVNAKVTAMNRLISEDGTDRQAVKGLESIGLEFDHVVHHLHWDFAKISDDDGDNTKQRHRRKRGR